MHLASQLRNLVRSAARPFTRVLADAGTAIADGDARFWGLAHVRPRPPTTGARPQEATP